MDTVKPPPCLITSNWTPKLIRQMKIKGKVVPTESIGADCRIQELVVFVPLDKARIRKAMLVCVVNIL